MVHGLLGFAPALTAANRTDQQQDQQDTGNRREDPLGSVSQRFRLAQPFGFGLVGRQRLFRGLGRRHLRRLGRRRRLLHIIDDNIVAVEGQHLVQLVLAGSNKPEGAGSHFVSQVGIHIPDKGSALSGGNAGKAVERDVSGLDGDVLHFHGAVIMYGHGETDGAGTLVDHVAVSLSFHPQGNQL